uniref:Uncharacterized protein n=1 Tax=Anguilla anguilla TaxID=7936 RepID=A0A0E9RRK0_ANGAN
MEQYLDTAVFIPLDVRVLWVTAIKTLQATQNNSAGYLLSSVRDLPLIQSKLALQ